MSKEAEVATIVFDKLEQYFDAAKQVIDQHGGDVAELGLNALRVDALSNLLPSLLILLLAYPCFRLAKKVYAYEKKTTKEGWGTIITGSTIVIFAGTYSITSLSDLWSWVGVFYPEIYAVHKFLM